MSDTTAPRPEPPKHDPETLVLKATPRRTVRIKRELLIGNAAVACGGVLGVTWLSLQGPGMRIGQQGQEHCNTERKPTPEGLAGLPGDYGQMRRGTPQLRTPLPGELGGPIQERHRQLGIAPGANMDDQAALAERQRLTQQAQNAREEGVFSQIATRPAPAAAALFHSEDGKEAQLVWNRRKAEGSTS